MFSPGDRAFKTAAPKIWKILPEDIRMQDFTINNIFKGELKKTHYFRLAYNFLLYLGVHKFYSIFD